MWIKLVLTFNIKNHLRNRAKMSLVTDTKQQKNLCEVAEYNIVGNVGTCRELSKLWRLKTAKKSIFLF